MWCGLENSFDLVYHACLTFKLVLNRISWRQTPHKNLREQGTWQEVTKLWKLLIHSPFISNGQMCMNIYFLSEERKVLSRCFDFTAQSRESVLYVKLLLKSLDFWMHTAIELPPPLIKLFLFVAALLTFSLWDSYVVLVHHLFKMSFEDLTASGQLSQDTLALSAPQVKASQFSLIGWVYELCVDVPKERPVYRCLMWEGQ